MKMRRKPDWIRSIIPAGKEYNDLIKGLKAKGISTVCQEANCPNLGECFGNKTSTMMIMGSVCTRNCKFCNVDTGNPKGVLDLEEPKKASEIVTTMGLRYIVVTSVDRDDLLDGGAEHFGKVIDQIHKDHPEVKVEVLIPDFRGREESLKIIGDAGPFVIAHNLETVKRLTPHVRDHKASYDLSLNVLKRFGEMFSHIPTKSSLMLGLGETDDEIKESLADLKEVGVKIVTFGQYLRPSVRHLEVEKYYTPEEFENYKTLAYEMGFEFVASGPMVRSSYKATDYLDFLESRI